MMLRMLCKMRKIGDADETREAASLCTGAEILFRVTSRLLSYQRLELHLYIYISISYDKSVIDHYKCDDDGDGDDGDDDDMGLPR